MISKIISYLFHPVLFPTIGSFLFFMIQPKYIPKDLEYNILLVVFLSTYIIPILFLLILKRKNNIESFHLKTIKERKFPILFFIILNALLGLRLLEFDIVFLLALCFISTAFTLIIVYFCFILKLKLVFIHLQLGDY